MRYIETLRDGDRVLNVYLCKTRSSAMTKTGKEYENVIFQDKTGQLDAKIWEPGSAGIGDFGALDYVEVTGLVTSYNGMLQLKVERARKVGEGEYDPRDYVPVSKKNIDEMYKRFLGYIESIKNPYLHQLLKSFFVEDEALAKRFRTASAAKAIHHGFVGGLLEHSLSLTQMCDYLAANYPALNRDLLLTAAMLHDIGKIREISGFPENDYTDEGNLLGHIVMGTEMVGERIRKIPGFPSKLEGELKHCILAHHGELEYGSPKKPALIEALALSKADDMDAKLETMTEILEAKEGSDWLGYNRLFESNIRRTSGNE